MALHNVLHKPNTRPHVCHKPITLITHVHRNLMAPDEMKNLGFANLEQVADATITKTAKDGQKWCDYGINCRKVISHSTENGGKAGHEWRMARWLMVRSLVIEWSNWINGSAFGTAIAEISRHLQSEFKLAAIWGGLISVEQISKASFNEAAQESHRQANDQFIIESNGLVGVTENKGTI